MQRDIRSQAASSEQKDFKCVIHGEICKSRSRWLAVSVASRELTRTTAMRNHGCLKLVNRTVLN
jgi:hypothetical protein